MPASGVLMNKAIKSIGGLAKFKRISKSYDANLRFIESCKNDLINRHDKQWVAVYNSAVVAHSNKLPKLINMLRKQNIPPEEALIQYLSSENILTLY
jgi:hypothetical protein